MCVLDVRLRIRFLHQVQTNDQEGTESSISVVELMKRFAEHLTVGQIEAA